METIDDKPPGIAERYAVASETSNLRIRLDKANQADVILAAGMCGQPRGAVFARLRSEFDQAHAEVVREAAGDSIGIANERMLVMMRLKSLKSAKTTISEMGGARMTRRGMHFAEHIATELMWQALSGWLDPRCPPCGGRGFIGGYNGPRVQCRKCDAGNRRGFLGKTDSERAFVSGLISDIDEAIQAFESSVGRALR